MKMDHPKFGPFLKLKQLLEQDDEIKQNRDISLFRYDQQLLHEVINEEYVINEELNQYKEAEDASFYEMEEYYNTNISPVIADNIQQCNEYTDRLNTVQYSLEELKQTIRRERAEFNAFKEKHQKLLKEKEKQTQKLIELKKEQESKWAPVVANYRKEVAAHTGKNSSLDKEIATIDKRNDVLKAQQLKISGDFETIKRRYKVAERDWNKKSNSLEMAVNAKKTELSTTESKRKSLTTKLSDLKTDNAYFIGTIKQTEDELAGCDREHEAAMKENEQMKEKVGDVQSQVDKTNKTLENLSLTKKHQVKQIESLKKKLKRLKQKKVDKINEKVKKRLAEQAAPHNKGEKKAIELGDGGSNARLSQPKQPTTKHDEPKTPPLPSSSAPPKTGANVHSSGVSSKENPNVPLSQSKHSQVKIPKKHRGVKLGGTKRKAAVVKQLSPANSIASLDGESFLQRFLFDDDDDVQTKPAKDADADSNKMDDTFENLCSDEESQIPPKKRRNKEVFF